tara:strand:- start:859 stop:1257 length:399 start_codon:yes stop_codon:yes gene_type:complete
MNRTEAARELIAEDPGLTVDSYLALAARRGLSYSREAFYQAAREWRSERGLGHLPKGPFRPHPVNHGAADRSFVRNVVRKAPQEQLEKDSIEDLAELVWEWMDEHDCASVTFNEDGSVRVEDKPERRFSLIR